MTNALRDEVIAFLRKNVGVKIDASVSDDKTLRDWGIDGADGWELIEEFGKEFSIDLSGFDAGKHFGPECDPLSGFAYYLLLGLFSREPPPVNDFIPITIRDLIRAAETKKWTI